MAAALIVVHPDAATDFHSECFRNIYTPEFATAIQGMPVGEANESELIVRRKVAPSRLAGLADEAIKLGAKADCDLSTVMKYGLIQRALSSPDLSKSVSSGLYANRRHLAPFFREALLANPNLVEHMSFSARDFSGMAFADGLAVFGDLSNPQVSHVMREVVGDSSPEHALTQTVVIDSLLSRKFLPEDTLVAMSTAANIGAEHYRKLVGRQDHLTAAKAGRVDLYRFFRDRHRCAVFSAVAPEALLKGKLRDEIAAFPDYAERSTASFAANPSCPISLFETIVSRGNVYAGEPAFRHSRWAINLVDAAIDGSYPAGLIDYDLPGMIAGAQAAHLAWNVTRGAGVPHSSHLRTVAHVNFPWEQAFTREGKFSQLLPMDAADSTRAGVYVALAARNSAIADSILNDKADPTQAFAMLFSQKTSSKKLESIAANFPEIAALAACHPNGYDVRADDSEPWRRAQMFREKSLVISLGNKSNLSGAGNAQSMAALLP